MVPNLYTHNRDTNKYTVILQDSEESWYDTHGNLKYYQNSIVENWYDYDSNGNLIHFRNSTGYEYWDEFDSKGNLVHHKNNNEEESWYEYDSDGYVIHYRDNQGNEYWKDNEGNTISKEQFDAIHNSESVTKNIIYNEDDYLNLVELIKQYNPYAKMWTDGHIRHALDKLIRRFLIEDDYEIYATMGAVITIDDKIVEEDGSVSIYLRFSLDTATLRTAKIGKTVTLSSLDIKAK